MRGTKAITDPLVPNNNKTMVLTLDSTHRYNKRKFLLLSPISIIVKMPTYDENLPKCSGCQFSTNSNNRCRDCLCYMHWFCSKDPINVKEKGFSAFYSCKNALRRNPLPITIQTTLNLFLVEGKRNVETEKMFSIHSPKLSLCVMIKSLHNDV
jgi:hypothetical protein